MPDWTSWVRQQLRRQRLAARLPRGSRREAEIAEEIAGHLRLEYEEEIELGAEPREAERRVRERWQDWEGEAEAIVSAEAAAGEVGAVWHPRSPGRPRAPRGRNPMEPLLQELRHALRRLVARPGLTVTIVAVLALAIGANAALFTLVHSILLAPLPYEDPGRLMFVTEANAGEATPQPARLNAANFLDLRERLTGFDDLTAHWHAALTLSGREFPVRVSAEWVTTSFFDVLDVEAALGNTFADDPGDAAYTAVITSGLWQREFGGDPSVVGETVVLSEQTFTIIGVLPPGFSFREDPEIFIVGPEAVPPPPVAFVSDYASDRGTGYLHAIGRLRPGVGPDQARAELTAVGEALALEYPDANAGRTFIAIEFDEHLTGDVKPALLALFGAVGLVLLIACANVANLLLARATRQERDIAVRVALGASRGRVVAQLLIDSLLLASIGGGAGLLLAVVGRDALVVLLPEEMPRLSEVAVDPAVLLFCLGLTGLTGLIFGLAPALRVARTDVQQVVRESSRGASESHEKRRSRDVLVVAEMAVAVVLLVGAGLMARSLVELYSRPPGFEPQGLTTMRLSLPSTRYDNNETIQAFYHELLRTVRTTPGVESAALSFSLPFTGTNANFSFGIWGDEPPADGNGPTASFEAISAGYFETMEIPVVLGRPIEERDDDQNRVVVVNQSFVRTFLSGREPLTQALNLDGGPDAPPVPIVGVVADVRKFGYQREPVPQVYMSFEAFTMPYAAVVVRSPAGFEDLAPRLRRAVASVDPDQPVHDLRPYAEVIADSVQSPRFLATLTGLFSGTALLLAAIGLFGVQSYAVSRQTRELGIRMALGAAPTDVRRAVLRRGVALGLTGTALGMIGAWWLMRTIEGLLYGVGATDPATFLAAPAVLLMVSVLATWLPALRATRVDPLVALGRG